MRKELEEQLVKLHPEILRDYGGDMRYTCMAWGMSHGDGWYDLLSDLLQTIDKIVANKKAVVIADQIKEKFGGLRFYYHIERDSTILDKFRSWFGNFMGRRRWGIQYNKIMDFKAKYLWKSIYEEVREAVDNAEILSYNTCEDCGKPGTRRGGGWVRVLCDDCENERQK